MEKARLVQLSLVICAASLALSGCATLLMGGALPGSAANSGTSLARPPSGNPSNDLASTRWQYVRRSLRRWTRVRRDPAR